MKKRSVELLTILFMLFSLCGCEIVDNANMTASILYGVMAIFSLLLLIGYCYLIRKKELWFLLLYSAIFISNIGYLSLSISKNLEEALLANRIVYLGSVCLPMSMWMIILKITRIKYKKWFPGLFLGIASLMFLVTASPGYLDIYYKETSFEIVNGIPILYRTYGWAHNLYLCYVLALFLAMTVTIFYAIIKKKTDSASHAVILVLAVMMNIVVWLLERIAKIGFEMLPVSYLLSGLLILGLQMVISEMEKIKSLIGSPYVAGESTDSVELSLENTDRQEDDETPEETATESSDSAVMYEEMFLSGVEELTNTERSIYDYYIAGKTTREIMAALNIKENTLKFHNKNIYSKLGVSSRKQLLETYKQLKKQGKIS